jgi:hypothetical protein
MSWERQADSNLSIPYSHTLEHRTSNSFRDAVLALLVGRAVLAESGEFVDFFDVFTYAESRQTRNQPWLSSNLPAELSPAPSPF